MIPVELREWQIWAQRLNTLPLHREHQLRDAAVAMPEPTVAELSALYKKAVAEKHTEKLNQWLTSIQSDSPASDEEKAIRNFFNLMVEMGRYGHIPFVRMELGRLIHLRPDWSVLPEELGFLARPAEQYYQRYAYLHDEETQKYIAATITDSERAELAALAKRIRRVGYPKVRRVQRELGYYSVESPMIYYLLAVLDAIGFHYGYPLDEYVAPQVRRNHEQGTDATGGGRFDIFEALAAIRFEGRRMLVARAMHAGADVIAEGVEYDFIGTLGEAGWANVTTDEFLACLMGKLSRNGNVGLIIDLTDAPFVKAAQVLDALKNMRLSARPVRVLQAH